MEGVDLGAEGREGGGDGSMEGGGGGGGNEVEVEIFRAGGVLEDGENRRHGAPEVRKVKSHSYVDSFLGAHIVGGEE